MNKKPLFKQNLKKSWVRVPLEEIVKLNGWIYIGKETHIEMFNV